MPDFGIMRGFGSKLFSDKLYAGQLPTQLGLIGSYNLYDIDAQSFFNRVSIAGGTLSVIEKNAVNQLVLDLKSYSIWSSMKAIYPMVGASAAACAQNLKSSSFTGTFSGGVTYSSTGVTGNGTNGYMNTGFNLNLNGSLNNQHFAIYSRTNIASAACDIGAYISPVENSLYSRYGGNILYSCVNSSLSSSTATNNNSAAFFIVLRNSSITENTFINNTKYTRTVTSISLLNTNIYIGALNNNSSAQGFSNREYAFASIGDGLTDTQASNFYTAVQAFQTTLSRQV